MDRVTRIAAGVIAKADRQNPADAVLRVELKRAGGIAREQGGTISRAVFAYYRWFGWLVQGKPIEQQIERAMELQEAFLRKPASFPERELQRAIPEWLQTEMEINAGWLRSLQAEPELWLRARPGQGSELSLKLGDCRSAGRRELLDG
jgi:16S rRNA (cytosine967-C5)-methyltransferase